VEREVIKAFLATSLFASIILSTDIDHPLKSDYIADLETKLISRSTASYLDLKIEYTMSIQSYPTDIFSNLYTAYPIDDVQDAMNEIFRYYFLFNYANMVKPDDCKVRFNVNIFIIGTKEMADPNRFKEYLESIGLSSGRVYAFYDTTENVYANSAILLTDVSPRQNFLSLAHEFAHYMWDRQCLGRYYEIDSEAFSRKFEYYIAEKTN